MLAGHSFGSIVAAAALAGEPRPAVRGLVLVNPIAASALAGPRRSLTRLTVLLPPARRRAAGAGRHLRCCATRLVTRIASVAMATTPDAGAAPLDPRRARPVLLRRSPTGAMLLEAFHASVAPRRRASSPPAVKRADAAGGGRARRHRPAARPARAGCPVPGRAAGRAARHRAPRPLRGARPRSPPRSRRSSRRSLVKILFDCRYVRTGRHDGISRYTAGLVTALAELHPVTMLISDERQLAAAPRPCPWHLVSAPTSVREPLVARQVRRLAPGRGVLPDADDGQLGPRLPAASSRCTTSSTTATARRRRSSPRRSGCCGGSTTCAWWPQRLLLNRADAVVTVSETTAALIARHRLTRRPGHRGAERAPTRCRTRPGCRAPARWSTWARSCRTRTSRRWPCAMAARCPTTSCT